MHANKKHQKYSGELFFVSSPFILSLNAYATRMTIMRYSRVCLCEILSPLKYVVI